MPLSVPTINYGGISGHVYVLLLEGGYFYVGWSSQVDARIAQHFFGEGSEWTKLHRPVQVLSCFPGDTEIEDATTISVMCQHGWERVRGGRWIQANLVEPPKGIQYAKTCLLFQEKRLSVSFYDMNLANNDVAKEHVRKLYAMGLQPSRIASLMPVVVSMHDVSKVVGVSDPNHVSDRDPVRATTKDGWLTEEHLRYLVDHVDVERLARCFRTIRGRGGYILLWKRFFEDFKNGRARAFDNPDRLPHKTAKKENSDLQAGLDRNALNVKHNRNIMHEQQRVTAAAASRKRTRRELEDASARESLAIRRVSKHTQRNNNSSQTQDAQPVAASSVA